MQLLVGGLEFLLRGLHLLAGSLQGFPQLLGLLLQVGAIGADVRLDRLAAPFDRGGRRHVGEDHQELPVQRRRFPQRPNSEVHDPVVAVGPDPQATPSNRLGRRLQDGPLAQTRQLVAQAVAGHGVQVPVDLTGRRLQILAGAPLDVEDIALLVGQHRRRAKLPQENVIHQGLQTGFGLDGADRRWVSVERRQEGGGKLHRLHPRRGLLALIKPPLAFQRDKQPGRAAHSLGGTQKQDAAGIQAIVEQGQQLLLQVRGQVDQQVAADQQIELGEGRIHDEVLGRQRHHLPDLLADPVAAFLLDEKPAQPLGRHIRRDVLRVDALAGLVNRVPIQIGGEDLQGKWPDGAEFHQRLFERDPQRIRLLAGRTARRPRPQLASVGPAGQQRRQNLFPQFRPGRRVAEKAGHADQQFLEQQIPFLGILLQVADVMGDPVDLVQAHAPLDAPVQGVLLVQGKVVAGMRPQQDHDLVQPALVLVVQGRRRLRDGGRVAEVGDQPLIQLLRGRDDVGQSGVDGAAWHPVELGRGRLLHQGEASDFLDCPQAQRAIAAHPRQDDAHAPLALVLGQGAEKEVNRQPQAPGCRRFEQMQGAAQQR